MKNNIKQKTKTSIRLSQNKLGNINDMSPERSDQELEKISQKLLNNSLYNKEKSNFNSFFKNIF